MKDYFRAEYLGLFFWLALGVAWWQWASPRPTPHQALPNSAGIYLSVIECPELDRTLHFGCIANNVIEMPTGIKSVAFYGVSRGNVGAVKISGNVVDGSSYGIYVTPERPVTPK